MRKKIKIRYCAERHIPYTRREREHMEFGTNGVKGNLIMGNYSNVHENTHTHRISITTIFISIHPYTMALAHNNKIIIFCCYYLPKNSNKSYI